MTIVFCSFFQHAFKYFHAVIADLSSSAATVGAEATVTSSSLLILSANSARPLSATSASIVILLLAISFVLTALAVSVAGLIGFVGLVVPHVLRILLGPDHRLLLPAAFFGGASFLVLADLLSRTIVAPGELPVGVVTALVGGPFFLYLLRASRGWHGF